MKIKNSKNVILSLLNILFIVGFLHAREYCLSPESLFVEEMINKIMLPSKARIYDSKFIIKEKSDTRKTIVFDFDETIASGISNDNFQTIVGYTLRNNIKNLLKSLKENNIKIVLWTNSASPKIRAFFFMYPELIKFFDLVITGDNFALPSDEEYKTAYGIDSEYMKEFYSHYHFYPKDIGLLGYDLIVDDQNDRLKEEKTFKSIGLNEYKVVLVTDDMKRPIEEHRIYQKLGLELPKDLNSALFKKIAEISS